MITELLLCTAAMLSGGLTKLTDMQTDDKAYLFKHAQYATGLAYGLLGGILITINPGFSTLFLSLVIGVLLTGKIDRKAHQIAVGATILVIALMGLPQGISGVVVVLFTFFAVADELINNYVDAEKLKGHKLNKLLEFVGTQRLTLEVAALVASAFTGVWAYFLGIILFDAGYIAAKKVYMKATPAVGSLGTHLAIDLFDCPTARLDDEKLVLRFLDSFPQKIRMKKLTRPIVKRVKLENDEGLSGFVMIQTSHVSIHTFPRIKSCNVDIFSCKDFDTEKAQAEVKAWFKARVVRTHVLQRGEVF